MITASHLPALLFKLVIMGQIILTCWGFYFHVSPSIKWTHRNTDQWTSRHNDNWTSRDPDKWTNNSPDNYVDK